MRLEAGARGLKNLLEQTAQREHGRPRVDGRALHVDVAQFSPGTCRALDYRYIEAVTAQLQRGDQAGDPGTNHGDMWGTHDRWDVDPWAGQCLYYLTEGVTI